MKWNKTLQVEPLIKNINPGYPFGIIIISTLQMREWTITRVKGLTQFSWLSGTARARTQTWLVAPGGAGSLCAELKCALLPLPGCVTCTLPPLQNLGCLGFADGSWQRSVLAGDSCSAIRYLFLIHALLSYMVTRYKQTGSGSSWLQSRPGGGNTDTLARGRGWLSAAGTGGRLDRRGRLGTGGSSAVMGKRQGGIAHGTEKGRISEAINLGLCSSAFENRRRITEKEGRRTKEHISLQVWAGALLTFLVLSSLRAFSWEKRRECISSPYKSAGQPGTPCAWRTYNEPGTVPGSFACTHVRTHVHTLFRIILNTALGSLFCCCLVCFSSTTI